MCHPKLTLFYIAPKKVYKEVPTSFLNRMPAGANLQSYFAFGKLVNRFVEVLLFFH